jgi:hypothetical protein
MNTRARFIVVAVTVCFFAVAMATFLNYYKYKSTFSKIVQSRLLVIGYGIDNSVSSSLALGLSFAELGELSSLLEREKASDPLLTGIDVFSSDGRLLYSTDAARVGKPVPAEWIEAATHGAEVREWHSTTDDELVTGISLKNNFNLTVGYLALRYTREYVENEVRRMGLELLLIGVVAFLAACLVVALALTLVLRRYERDMSAIAARISGSADAAAVAPQFSPAVEGLRNAIQEAESGLAQVRDGLARG